MSDSLKFATTGCSSCGRLFGPGDQGYSHCDQHAALEMKVKDSEYGDHQLYSVEGKIWVSTSDGACRIYEKQNGMEEWSYEVADEPA